MALPPPPLPPTIYPLPPHINQPLLHPTAPVNTQHPISYSHILQYRTPQPYQLPTPKPPYTLTYPPNQPIISQPDRPPQTHIACPNTSDSQVGGALTIKRVQPEGNGNTFIIDSKTFTLGFDGGRTDPYHIMERRGRFRGSLWLGLGGLRWLVNTLLKIRGAHRGNIRLPEGRRGAGWSLFEFQGSRPLLPKSVTNPVTEMKDTRLKMDMAIKAPRPTRLSHFVWKPKAKTLRITVKLGSRRIVEWVDIGASNGVANGLKLASDVQTSGPLDSEAQQPIKMTNEGVDGLLDTKKPSVSQFYVGEASGTKEINMESTICDSTDDDDDSDSENSTEPSVVGSDGVFNDGPVDSGEVKCCETSAQVIPPMTEDEQLFVSEVEASPVRLTVEEEISLPLVLFSLDTDEAGMSEEGVANLPANFILEEPWNSDPLSVSSILGDFGNYTTGDNQSPLSCTPLDRIEPLDFAAFTQGYTGDILALEEAMSIWVEQRYKGFKKLVGMDLLGFEDECISLLRRIDAERKRLRPTTGPRYPKGSVNKGLNNPRKREVVKNLLRDWKVDVVCLQETKLAAANLSLIRSIWGNMYVGWEVLNAINSAGGILLMWDKRALEKLDYFIGTYSVSCQWKSLDDNFIWSGSSIYGPNSESARSAFWDELNLISNRWATPSCLFGDFNIIRYPGERLGCQNFSQGMLDFSEFIDSNHLVDLPLEGGLYTWSNGADQPSMSRIDRVLVSVDWEEHFPDVSQKLLPRPLSDHSPILVEAGGMARGKSSFKFENMWLKSEGFVELVKGWWSGYSFGGPSSRVLARKLKALKGDLKSWNKNTFGDNAFLGRRLKLEVDRLAHLAEVSWRQKSRVLCLKEGDNNTKFFHKMANSHRRRNQIKSIEVDGTQFEEESEIRNQVVQFYKSLYHEHEEWRPDVDGLSFTSIGEEAKDRLERRFDKEEVVQVLKDLEGDKAPGPDGFTMAFFQKCWPVLQDDIMGFFEEVYDQGQFESSLNATFLALIPKKNDARNIKDFRPISLMEVFISCFLRCWPIDSRSRLKRRQPGVICKLDIEKAYDHVNWNCLIHLMDTMGFGTKWQCWIRACISTVRYSVLINGSPAGFFGSSRGLRQGDPLSPLLFLLVMEILSKILKKVEDSGLIRGFQASRSGVPGLSISHILFADDTMIMCDADPVQLMYLRLAMTCFEASTGLRVNLGKSEIVPVGDVVNLRVLADILCCRIGSLPMNYLGMPLGSTFKSTLIWNPIIEKMERRLAGWKRLYLSTGGRLTLLKSTLSSLPTFYLSLFTIPCSIAKRIEQIQRKFLWGGSDDTFKHCLVKWDTVCSPVSKGGLGVRKLVPFNRALLDKWLWRFGVEDNRLWKRVLVERHGAGCGDWSTGWTRDSHGCGLWKGIMLGWNDFSAQVKFKVGRGNRVRLWHDRWCGDVPLKESFPALYACASNKSATISEVLVRENGRVDWQVTFLRNFNDWELDNVASFLGLLQNHCPSRVVEDGLWWSLKNSGIFDVRSRYSSFRESPSLIFPWKCIWRTKAPRRACFFVWTAAWQKILTCENLRKRGYSITSWCCMCCCNGETVEHLLLHCHVAGALWNWIFQAFGISWVMSGTVADLLHSWWNGLGRHSSDIWNFAPACLMWTIWKERNQRTFEDVSKTDNQILEGFIQTLFDWSKTWGFSSCISIPDFISSLYLLSHDVYF
uniref:Reverse transcriptase domain-containing protein n=1 Tax=Fagus sylvatica TaxID=28930 RepID=A0A2N9F2D7_FAGSY